jgi:hypothetical protein
LGGSGRIRRKTGQTPNDGGGEAASRRPPREERKGDRSLFLTAVDQQDAGRHPRAEEGLIRLKESQRRLAGEVYVTNVEVSVG